MSKIKEIIGDTCRESTTHGIPHIAKRENWVLRILWLLCFLGSAGFCVYLMINSINDYTKYETVTKTEVVEEIPSLFPTITICNINMFMTPVSYNYVMNFLIKSKLISNEDDFKLVFGTYFGDDFMFLKYFVGKNAFDPNVSKSLKQQFGFKLEYTLLSCLFNLNPCSADDFVWYFDPFYGNCYKFNSGRNSSGHSVPDRITTNAGKINGLLVEILVGEPNNMKSLAVSSGLHVLIHNKSVQPSFFKGIDVATGTQTNIGIERTFVSKLSDPFSDCTDKIDYERYPLLHLIQASNNSYSQSLCFNLCYQEYLVDKCGCYDASVSIWYNTSRLCLSLNDTICSSRILSFFFSQDVRKLCSNDCPLECKSVMYSTTMSFSNYPTAAYAEHLKANPLMRLKIDNDSWLTYDDLKRNSLSLNIFYETLTYKHFLEQEKTSKIDLISNLGGTLGLFLGMSFLSLVEIVDLLIQIMIVLLSRPKETTNKISA